MATLKGTKTEENLKAAFAGESQANRRYLYFANKADVEGQQDIAALFRSTTEGETGHAHGHLEWLEQCGDPATGLDLLKILDHNEVPYVIVEKEKCCGMPKLELGDLDSVNASKEANIPVLVKYANDGFAILAAVPSCALMFKQEISLLFPDDADVQRVKEAMWDPFEYLMQRKRDGLLKTDFPVPLGNVSYQIPCHGRVQNIGKKTEEMLKMIPDTTINTIERCSGHAGTFGVKKAHHQTALKIGKPVFKAMATMKDGAKPDFISSDCPLGGHHIAQGFEVNDLGAPALQHPLSLVARAYGLK